MNDKIKQLREIRDLALTEKYKALIVKQNAEIDYRRKTEVFNEMDEKLQEALQEEANNDATKH